MDDPEYLISEIAINLNAQSLPFIHQVDTLQKILQPRTTSAISREKILNDLTTLLNTNYPNSQLHLFGSSALDLDLPGSKVDVYVHNEQLNKQTYLNNLKTVISQSEKFENVLVHSDFSRIECKHIETQTLCSLSSDKSRVRGTRLVQCYLSLDVKIRSLMLIMKFWCKCRHLVEPQGFSSYVLYLLVIFYLQQHPYKLPSVVNLLEETDSWKCDSTKVNLESFTIFDLVSGFLKFYNSFDYISYVVTPFCGLAFEKTCFLEPYLLPPCYKKYVDLKKPLNVDCGLCVQDPFDHSLNLLNGDRLTVGGNFASHCHNSLILGDRPFLTNMLRISENRNFTVNKLEELSDDEFVNSVKKITTTILDGICGYELKIVRVNSDKHIYNCSKRFEDFWKDRMSILKDLLLELPSDVSETNKEMGVTTTTMMKIGSVQSKTKKWTGNVEAKFEKNPTRVEFTFKKFDDSHFEHFFRIKMFVFLREIVTEKWLSSSFRATAVLGEFHELQVIVNNLIQNGDASVHQFSILQTLFEDYAQNVKAVRDDVAVTLLPWFPESNVHLATANLDILSSFVHVCLSKIQPQNLTISLLQNIISQSIKFDNVKIFSDKEIRCRHIKTQTPCRLSIDKLALKRAQLVEHFLNLDDKVYSLAIAVTYWAHCHELVGPEGFSTYSLCLLVIFYLQQEPYDLPVVADLQDLCDSQNYSVSTLQNATLFELLTGFFTFFANFDYLYLVVSPYCGFGVEKIRFLYPYDVPSCFYDYPKKKNLSINMAMCIQDPFDHDTNVLDAASPLCGGNFTSRCSAAVADASNEGFSLYNILNRCRDSKISILKIDNCNEDEWVSCTDSVVTGVLTKILGFDVRTELKSKLHKICYSCVAKGDIWTGRLITLKRLSPKWFHTNDFAKEVALSAETLKKNKIQVEGSITIQLHFKVDPHRIEITMLDVDSSCMKVDVERFLSLKLAKFLDEYISGNASKVQNNILIRKKRYLTNRTIHNQRPFKREMYNAKTPAKYRSKFFVGNRGAPRGIQRGCNNSQYRQRNPFKTYKSKYGTFHERFKDNIKGDNPKRGTSDAHRFSSFSRYRNRTYRTPASAGSTRERLQQRKTFLKDVRQRFKETGMAVVPPLLFYSGLLIPQVPGEQPTVSPPDLVPDGSKSVHLVPLLCNIPYPETVSNSTLESKCGQHANVRVGTTACQPQPPSPLNTVRDSGDQHTRHSVQLHEKMTVTFSESSESGTTSYNSLDIAQAPVQGKTDQVMLHQASFGLSKSAPQPPGIFHDAVSPVSPIVPFPQTPALVPGYNQSPNLTVVQLQEVKSPNCDKEMLMFSDDICCIVDDDLGVAQASNQESKDQILLQCTRTLKLLSNQITNRRFDPVRLRVSQIKKQMTTQGVKRLRNSNPTKYSSPVRKLPINFRFTSLGMELCAFETILLDILHLLGICDEPDDISDLMESVVEDFDSGVAIDKVMVGKILQISLLGAMKSQELFEKGEL